jgi:hypothetical protein
MVQSAGFVRRCEIMLAEIPVALAKSSEAR